MRTDRSIVAVMDPFDQLLNAMRNQAANMVDEVNRYINSYEDTTEDVPNVVYLRKLQAMYQGIEDELKRPERKERYWVHSSGNVLPA